MIKDYNNCNEYLLTYLGTIMVCEYNFHQMHRNVGGLINEDFHERMQEFYEYLYEQQDIIAERLGQLGIQIPTNQTEVTSKSILKYLSNVPEINQGIKLSIDILEILITLTNKGIQMSIGKNDFVTEDILRGIGGWASKEKWKLERWIGKVNNLLKSNNEENDKELKLDSESNKEDGGEMN